MQEMIRTQYNYIQSGTTKFTYEREIILESPNTYSDWILIPPDINTIVLTYLPIDSGTGLIQTTNDLMENIKNNTAYPFDWCYGVISRPKENSLYPIKAVRLLNILGKSKMIVSAF